MNDSVGLILNPSQGIINVSNDENFAKSAAEKAKELQSEMAIILSEHS